MELALIEWLRSRVGSTPNIALGIGDDGAILSLSAEAQLVVSTDMLLDGVHFDVSRTDPRRVGRKCLAVNLSDVAAMAARPIAAFVSLALPRDGGLSLGKALFDGMLPLADEFQVSIAGGDTNSWSRSLVVSVTVLGLATERGPLTRGGAVVGDALLATGSFGGSILGRHLDFPPRIHEALTLHERYALHAGIDVSDGMALDVSRLANESRCGACLDLAQVPISEAAYELGSQDGVKPLDHALGDGEDFELIFAVAPDDARRILADRPLDVPVTRIGEIIAEPGLWKASAEGPVALTATGFEHA